MHKPKALIVGDTRDFHIGSLVNCSYLSDVISKKYDFLGFFGKNDFCYDSYDHLRKKIKNRQSLIKCIEKSQAIFCHGEGMIEAQSKWGNSLFYLAKYIKNTWPNKKVYLVNFSCFDKNFEDWTPFNKIIPRDIGTYECLSKELGNLRLGFDC